MKEKVRVRFAPSPTGYLHIGGARTALFNWLFARNQGGSFILRIDDTDRARSTQEALEHILVGLRWLGLDWDEGPEVGGDYGPYFQGEKLPFYKSRVDNLLAAGRAYYCYCQPDELAKRREKALTEGRTTGYDGHCARLSRDEEARLKNEGRQAAVRFRVGTGYVEIDDLIHGRVRFDQELLEDFVIWKSDGTPTYNFASVVDDNLMQITHIIRGDDHISNTPRQAVLFEAMGFGVPQFAHIPLILGSDGNRLSKRHGAVAVTYYRDAGYLPEAVVNYLALLGWSPGDDREILSRDELIKEFSLARVIKRSAVFDWKKLEWMNGQYIRQLDLDRLLELVMPFLDQAGYLTHQAGEEKKLHEILPLLQERIRLLAEIVEAADFFFLPNLRYDPEAVEKVLRKEGVKRILTCLRERLAAVELFDEKHVEEAARKLIAELGIGAGKLIHPTRVALTGRRKGPGLFETIAVLGKEIALNRLTKAIDLLGTKE